MRGKGLLLLGVVLRLRITPAYAGKSRKPVHHRKPMQDHPRLCGEKTDQQATSDRPQGSPPPMRGKVRLAGRAFKASGITPAYAGKSLAKLGDFQAARDHPRLCGEKAYKATQDDFDKGSPPPMRGKGEVQKTMERSKGITPAYAGKSAGCHIQPKPDRDHPRLCGEKCTAGAIQQPQKGSPPPMRGKVKKQGKFRHFCRITPAYAGKRGSKDQSGAILEDHPRLCGEKCKPWAFFNVFIGSPPPMRGKEPRLVCSLHTSRITPAYAGKRSG